jgi:hypothetical protein
MEKAMAEMKAESVCSWTGVALMIFSGIVLSIGIWQGRMEVMLISLFPMLLGAYLTVYRCKHELASGNSSRSDSDSTESLVKSLTLVQKIVDARNQMLRSDASMEARNAERRFFEIVNELLAWLQDKGRRSTSRSGQSS